jgi:hypothetical protein
MVLGELSLTLMLMVCIQRIPRASRCLLNLYLTLALMDHSSGAVAT